MVGEVLENNLGFPLLRRCKGCDLATRGFGMASTAASKIRNTAHVAATSSSARCVETGAPKVRTKSISRWDFRRGEQCEQDPRSQARCFPAKDSRLMSRGEGAIEGGIMSHKLRITNELPASCASASSGEGASATSSS